MDLAKSFVNLLHVALAPQRVAKLPLDRGEGWISTADVGGCTATVLQPGWYEPVHDGQSNSTKWSKTA